MLLKVLPAGNFLPHSLQVTPDYTVVHCELVPADGTDSSVNQPHICPFSVIWHREFPVRLKQGPDAGGNVRGSRNISVTASGRLKVRRS